MNQVGTARWFQGNIFQVVLSSRLAASIDGCSLLLFVALWHAVMIQWKTYETWDQETCMQFLSLM